MLESGAELQQHFTVPAVVGQCEEIRESHIFCENTRREYIIRWSGGEIISTQVIKAGGL